MEPKLPDAEMVLLHFAAERQRKRNPFLMDISDLDIGMLYNLARIPMDIELDDLSTFKETGKEKADGPLGSSSNNCSSEEPGLRPPMKSDRVDKIVEHAVEVIKEVLKELLAGEEEKHDEATNPGQTGDDTPEHHKDLA